MTPEAIQGWLQLGLGGLLLVVLLLGHKRLWTFGWYAKELEEDRDFWRTTALSALGHADRAIDVVSKRG